MGNIDSFSIIHALAYSFIGYQTIYIATNWNPIFWNTACLIINSGSLEDNTDEDDCDDEDADNKKSASTDYAKVAKAIGDITSKGIKVSLVDINNSEYSFKPDVENNEILFGMKGLNKVGDPIIEQIVANRPYTGIKDFMRRCPLNKTAMISLIKAGAFDKVDNKWASEIDNAEPRRAIMAYYISQVCEPKKKLTLQNFNGLIEKNMIPQNLKKYSDIFRFNKYLKANCKLNEYYRLDESCLNFYNFINGDLDKLSIINNETVINQKTWDKIYKEQMENVREWLSAPETLNELNNLLFKETWDKYAAGTISAWEMESLCFYYHPHELINVDVDKYGIVDFNSLSPEPAVDYFFKRNGKDIPIYQTFKIMGTIISKNDTRSSISLLTTTGVVNVKFSKEHFAMYNRQISEVQSDGTKKIIEKGWFSRGAKVMVTGFRKDDTFNIKTYKHTSTHSIYKIMSVNGKDMQLEHTRFGIGET